MHLILAQSPAPSPSTRNLTEVVRTAPRTFRGVRTYDSAPENYRSAVLARWFAETRLAPPQTLRERLLLLGEFAERMHQEGESFATTVASLEVTDLLMCRPPVGPAEVHSLVAFLFDFESS